MSLEVFYKWLHEKPENKDLKGPDMKHPLGKKPTALPIPEGTDKLNILITTLHRITGLTRIDLKHERDEMGGGVQSQWCVMIEESVGVWMHVRASIDSYSAIEAVEKSIKAYTGRLASPNEPWWMQDPRLREPGNYLQTKTPAIQQAPEQHHDPQAGAGHEE